MPRYILSIQFADDISAIYLNDKKLNKILKSALVVEISDMFKLS